MMVMFLNTNQGYSPPSGLRPKFSSSITSCSHSHLSRMFRHWMTLCLTMKSSPSGALQHYQVSMSQYGIAYTMISAFDNRVFFLVRGWRYFTPFAEPQGVALYKRLLNSILSSPMFSSSLVNESLGKGKGRPFNEHLITFSNLQMSVCFMPTSCCLSS